MDTYGNETGRDVVLRAASDHAVTCDTRTLHHLSATVKTCQPGQVSYYFNGVQTDIEPYMRRIVAVWMFEVCKMYKWSQTETQFTSPGDFKGTTGG